MLLSTFSPSNQIYISFFKTCFQEEKKAAVKIILPDEDSIIDPVPAEGGGGKAGAEMEHLSVIIQTFNDLFGNIDWNDKDRIQKIITEELPVKLEADLAYKNAQANSDKQNARIEHAKALARVITSFLKDDTELFKQFFDNESFRTWLADKMFNLTYKPVRG